MSVSEDVVTRLERQGADAFMKHYSLGMHKLCSEAAAEITSLRSELARKEWQPIETAPKGPDFVLLWCGFAIVGRWIGDGVRVKGGWTDDHNGVNPIYHVTNWMPLPSPPASSEVQS